MEAKINKQNITDRKPSIGERFLLWFLPLIIVTLQRLLGLTSRRIDIGRESLDRLRSEGRPWIYAIWHTNVFFSPYLNRNQNVAVMISASKDGEYIARVVKRFGNDAIRGSTSRGGIRALKNMVAHLKQGSPAAITPDGPRGPAFRLQAGIVTSSQTSRVPIIPFHYECTRQWIVRRAWDNHRVPLPFTTFVVSYGEPIYIDRNLSAEDFEKMVEFVEQALLDNMRRCQAEVIRITGRDRHY